MWNALYTHKRNYLIWEEIEYPTVNDRIWRAESRPVGFVVKWAESMDSEIINISITCINTS